MDPQAETITLTAECLCKANIITTEISTSKLPFEASICHCNSCRHSTGALFVTATTWPQPREDVNIDQLKAYHFSANTIYRFCGTCSSLMFYELVNDPSHLGVFTGVLRNTNVDLIRFTKHMFVEDTLDGGASVWLRSPNADGKEIPRYRERSGETLAWDWPGTSTLREPEEVQEKKSVSFSCHCKGIELVMHRGNYDTDKRKGEIPWFVDPATRKLLATFDACDSCRLQFGVDIVNWCFVHLANISLKTAGASSTFPSTTPELKEAVDAGDSAVGTLAYYTSSEDVQRYFCKNCSASVFYACDDRPEIVDVPVGLLESEEGARTEEFLFWNFGDRASWEEDAKGGWREGFWKKVQDDAEGFRVERGYPKSRRRVDRETKMETKAHAS